MTSITQVMINGSLVESAANTLTPDQLEVPGSQGATKVTLVECKLQIDPPDAIAGVSRSQAVVQTGLQTPTNPFISQDDAVCAEDFLAFGSAAGTYVFLVELQRGQLSHPVDVQVQQNSGEYYVTLAVQGEANTNVKTVYYSMTFNVTR